MNTRRALGVAAVTLVAAAVAGCAAPPEVRWQPVEVPVPVPVPCVVEIPKEPEWQVDKVRATPPPAGATQQELDAYAFALAQAHLVDREKRSQHFAEVKAAMAGCQVQQHGGVR